MKYFTETHEYVIPYRQEEVFPSGHLYSYISGAVLDGVINYVEPIKAYILNRYTDWNEEINRSDFTGTKNKLYESMVNCSHSPYHIKMSCFGDDILLIGRVKSLENWYFYFWYDMDISDCSICRFYTEDSEENIVKEFDKHVLDIQSNMNYLENNEHREFKLDWFRGWRSF